MTGFLQTVAFAAPKGGGEGGLDRAARLREDAEALARLGARPGARGLRFRAGDPLVADGGAGPRLVAAPPGEGALFLGLAGGEGVWAEAAPDGGPDDGPTDGPAGAPEGARWADLRGVMTGLDPVEAECAAAGRALLHWHDTHGFCARCGAPSRVAQAGWRRDCPACGASHFPRTDPVAIMLVTRGERALLGRSPGWPPGMVSLLAGFMEPGETLEGAVRREVWEEAGVRVGAVRYLASQPWPFPASLMLGAWGEGLSDDIALDPEELEAAEWVDRGRLLRVMAGRDPAMRAPRPGAIASAILRAWLADALP